MGERRDRIQSGEILKASGLSGIVVPLMVPFIVEDQKLAVDTLCQAFQIRRLIKAGVQGIFLGSNAGEGRQMDSQNWIKSIESGILAVDEMDSNASVVVGVLREDPQEAVALAQFAEKKGADAIVIAPGFTKGNPYDIRDRILRGTSRIPMILYNNPEFQGGVDLPIEFFQDSTKNRRIIAVKDTSRKPEYFAQLLRLRNPNTFHVFQGDTQAGMKESIKSSDGMVPVEANLYPEVLVRLWNQGTSGELAEVLKYFKENKSQNGGTLMLIKKILFDAGMFRTPLMYQ